MFRLLEQLIKDNVRSAGVVVHIGAGFCRELRMFEELGATAIVLVEPNPDTARALRSRASTAEVVEAAIASEDGKATYKVTNDPRFGALREPDELLKFYPGIQVVDQCEVATLSFATLVSRLDLGPESGALLVVEAPGVNEYLLARAARDDLKRFRHILIRAFDGRVRATECRDPVRAKLSDADFYVVKLVEQDSPFSVYLATKSEREVLFENESARRMAQLEQVVGEYEHRQALVDIELARARGQIDLIKDILLGE